MAKITKVSDVLLPAQVQKAELLDMAAFSALADKSVNYAIEGFTFNVGDKFSIAGFMSGSMDMSDFPLNGRRAERLAKSQGKPEGEAPDLANVVVPYIAINLTTKDGKTEVRGISADRLLNSDVPSTNTGYSPEVSATLADLRKSDRINLTGKTADRLKQLGDDVWEVKYSDNPVKRVNMGGQTQNITPYIYAFEKAK